MSEQNENQNYESPRKSRNVIFPWLVILISIVSLFVLYFFDTALEAAFNLDPAVKYIASFLLPLIALTSIGLWYLLRRARSFQFYTVLALLALLAPVVFFLLYQPVFGGNADLEGFVPRFWGKTDIVTREAESTTSRLTKTEFDFPQFLGPDRDGVIRNVELAAWSGVQPELLWKQSVGTALSGFAVVNGYAITQEQREDQECVVCYEIETGKTVWMHSGTRRYEDYASFGRVGPRATPLVHNGNVYALGGTGVLECLNGEDGSVIWTYDIAAECGIEHVPKTNSRGLAITQESSSLAWGRSQSPLLVDDMIIVAGGGIAKVVDSKSEVADTRVESPGATLIAINKETGEEVWRGGDRPIAYGSPTLATIAGVRQILIVVEDHCVAHDPKTGHELWCLSWPGNSSGPANCSQVTVLDDDHLMISKGYSTGAQIVLLQQEEGKLVPVPEARDSRVLKTKFSNPVIHDEFAYAISDRFLECAEAMTLKKKWRRRGFGTGQLLLVGDKLLVHADRGKLVLVEAFPDEYRELGSIETVKGTCWNTLALSKDLVLVRSDKEAACYRLPLKE